MAKTNFVLVFVVFVSLHLAFNAWKSNGDNGVDKLVASIGISNKVSETPVYSSQPVASETSMQVNEVVDNDHINMINKHISDYQNKLVEIASLPPVPQAPLVPPPIASSTSMESLRPLPPPPLSIQTTTVSTYQPPPPRVETPVVSISPITYLPPKGITPSLGASIASSNTMIETPHSNSNHLLFSQTLKPTKQDVLVFVHIPKTAGRYS